MPVPSFATRKAKHAKARRELRIRDDAPASVPTLVGEFDQAHAERRQAELHAAGRLACYTDAFGDRWNHWGFVALWSADAKWATPAPAATPATTLVAVTGDDARADSALAARAAASGFAVCRCLIGSESKLLSRTCAVHGAEARAPDVTAPGPVTAPNGSLL